MANRKAARKARAERLKSRLPTIGGFRPNPCELDAIVVSQEIVETYRYHECQGYKACLDVACLASWQSFSCRACDIYHHKKPVRKRWAKRIRGVQ